MAWDLVQEESSAVDHTGFTTTETVTFTSTPTEGNDMFAIGLSRPEDTSGAAPTHVLTSGGNTWTEIATAVTSNHRMSIFHRVAGASEATAVTLTATHSDTTFSYSLGLMELSGPPVDVNTISVLAQEANTGSATSETVTTGTLDGTPHLFISGGSIRINAANGGDQISVSSSGTALLNSAFPAGALDTDRWGARGIWFEKLTTATETITYSAGSSAQTIGLLVGVVPQGYNVIATDDFNRADGAVGANYTTMYTTAPSITSNVVNIASSADTGAYWSANTFDNDQWAEVDATCGASTSRAAAIVRGAQGGSSTVDGYAALWSDASSGTYSLQRITNGSWTQIGTPQTGVGTTGTRTLRIEAVGTQVTMYVDGVEEVTQSDSNHTSGAPGLYGYRDATGSVTLDNFSAGDWIDTLPITPTGASVTVTPGGTTVTTAYAVSPVGASVTVTPGVLTVTGATVPSAVSDLAGTAGNAQVVLTWSAPSDGGSAITDYIVEYREA